MPTCSPVSNSVEALVGRIQLGSVGDRVFYRVGATQSANGALLAIWHGVDRGRLDNRWVPISETLSLAGGPADAYR